MLEIELLIYKYNSLKYNNTYIKKIVQSYVLPKVNIIIFKYIIAVYIIHICCGNIATKKTKYLYGGGTHIGPQVHLIYEAKIAKVLYAYSAEGAGYGCSFRVICHNCIRRALVSLYNCVHSTPTWHIQQLQSRPTRPHRQNCGPFTTRWATQTSWTAPFQKHNNSAFEKNWKVHTSKLAFIFANCSETRAHRHPSGATYMCATRKVHMYTFYIVLLPKKILITSANRHTCIKVNFWKYNFNWKSGQWFHFLLFFNSASFISVLSVFLFRVYVQYNTRFRHISGPS